MTDQSQIHHWTTDAQGVAATVRDLGRLSAAQISWRPGPGAWSIAECLDHIMTTDEKASAHWKAAAARARQNGVTGTGPFRLGWLGSWFVRQVGPNPSRKVSAPAIFAPASAGDPLENVARFGTRQQELIRFIESLGGLDLGRVKARSAVSALFRLNLAAWVTSALAHQHRHLEQIDRNRLHPSFPRT